MGLFASDIPQPIKSIQFFGLVRNAPIAFVTVPFRNRFEEDLRLVSGKHTFYDAPRKRLCNF